MGLVVLRQARALSVGIDLGTSNSCIAWTRPDGYSLRPLFQMASQLFKDQRAGGGFW